MDILNTISLESNSCFKMNFNGGNLSSDAGLLMIYDFMRGMGVEDIISKIFSTSQTDSFRKHSDSSILLQFLYEVFASYFLDNCADYLRKVPLFTRLVDNHSSCIPAHAFPFLEQYGRFCAGPVPCDPQEDEKISFSISMPWEVILDLDSNTADCLWSTGEQTAQFPLP